MDKSKEIVRRVVADVGGAFTVGLGYIGDRLGLFTALAAKEACSSGALAEETGLNERYLREWLKGMVAAEYIEYDPDSDTYFMTPEQKAVFSDDSSPVFAGGVFQFALPSLFQTPRILDSFRNGGGISFLELGEEIADAIDRMHRPWFDHLLTQDWLPRVPGLVERLRRGISVLDIGCGLGRASVALARAYSESRVVGIDPHAPSIRKAKKLALECEVRNVEFLDLSLEGMPRDPKFDLVLAIDSIHDMVDPVGALRVVKELLASDGLVLWSEPTGSHNPLENRNLFGKMRANLSPFHCLTVSMAGGGAALGTIIGEAGGRKLAAQAGFAHFERFDIDSPVQQFFGLRP
ncbi:MAG: methyltransferase domain-containing protein [Deltaproteobacteria bacterium]|nr:methyltransferase domain-containing protein [Deltaproteobacteria bacterium]